MSKYTIHDFVRSNIRRKIAYTTIVLVAYTMDKRGREAFLNALQTGADELCRNKVYDPYDHEGCPSDCTVDHIHSRNGVSYLTRTEPLKRGRA